MAAKLSFYKDPRIHLFLVVASLLLIVVPILNKRPAPEVAEASALAAHRFLHLVDTEEYTRSWEVTSRAMKKILSQQAWNEKITSLRKMAGPILERRQHDIAYTDSAPDVPAGEYVVITFVSRFARRGYVIETITLLLSQRGTWQVAGYYLK